MSDFRIQQMKKICGIEQKTKMNEKKRINLSYFWST